MRKIITLYLLLLAVFPLKAFEHYDFLFLHQAEDGETYLYAYAFDGEAQQVLETPIQDYDAFGHWVIYRSDSKLMRLDVESGENIVFYECSEEAPCGEPHFGADENTIFFMQLDTSEPLADLPSLFRLSLGAEPEVISGAVDYEMWLTEYLVLSIYDPMGEPPFLNFYDARTDSSQALDTEAIGCFLCGGISFIYRADAQQYFVASETGLELRDISGELIASYPYPLENYDLLLLHAWNPVNETILYTAYPYDEDGMPSSADHIFLFNLSDGSTQTLLEQDESDIFGLKWNPTGTQFTFIAAPLHLTRRSTPDEYQIWLYDMETEAATSLPLFGYNLQWIQ